MSAFDDVSETHTCSITRPTATLASRTQLHEIALKERTSLQALIKEALDDLVIKRCHEPKSSRVC